MLDLKDHSFNQWSSVLSGCFDTESRTQLCQKEFYEFISVFPFSILSSSSLPQSFLQFMTSFQFVVLSFCNSLGPLQYNQFRERYSSSLPLYFLER